MKVYLNEHPKSPKDGASLFLQIGGKSYSLSSKNYSDYLVKMKFHCLWSKVQHVTQVGMPEQLCGHSEEAGGSYSQNTESNAYELFAGS